MVSPKLKRHLNSKNTLSDHDSIHGHRNLNYNERSAIARHRNFNAPKICKNTVAVCRWMNARGTCLTCARNSMCSLSTVITQKTRKMHPCCGMQNTSINNNNNNNSKNNNNNNNNNNNSNNNSNSNNNNNNYKELQMQTCVMSDTKFHFSRPPFMSPGVFAGTVLI